MLELVADVLVAVVTVALYVRLLAIKELLLREQLHDLLLASGVELLEVVFEIETRIVSGKLTDLLDEVHLVLAQTIALD